MKHLRKPTKSDLLVNLFPEIGTKMKVEEVCDITGISSYGSLRSFCTYLRKAEHISEDCRVDIRIDDGECIRVN